MLFSRNSMGTRKGIIKRKAFSRRQNDTTTQKTGGLIGLVRVVWEHVIAENSEGLDG